MNDQENLELTRPVFNQWADLGFKTETTFSYRKINSYSWTMLCGQKKKKKYCTCYKIQPVIMETPETLHRLSGPGIWSASLLFSLSILLSPFCSSSGPETPQGLLYLLFTLPGMFCSKIFSQLLPHFLQASAGVTSLRSIFLSTVSICLIIQKPLHPALFFFQHSSVPELYNYLFGNMCVWVISGCCNKIPETV